MTEAAIDIVIPLYNPGKVFKSCIKSILNQSFQQWNLILVDDGSTDGSEKLCDRYSAKDSRITVIHQKNQGSVASRKNGVLECDPTHFITFCDADDMLTVNALEKLYSAAIENNADIVCGNSIRFFKCVKIKEGYQRPCFNEKKTYSHQEILDELYVSYFGSPNFPNNLWAKLYRYDLIREAVEQPPVVNFYSDDLSVMCYILPRVNRLTIIPDTVYRYRIGGGTSHYMSFMMDDCLAMYHYKKKLSDEWTMPQDVDNLLKMELKNIVYSWLRMYREKGGFSEEQCVQEIERVCCIPEIVEAMKLHYKDHYKVGFRDLLRDRKYSQILAYIDNDIHQGGVKQTIRNFLMKL